MNAIDVLRAAKSLISDPERHISATNPDWEAHARHGLTLPQKVGDCFCALGATWETMTSGVEYGLAMNSLETVANRVFGLSLVQLNDTMGYDAVHVAFDVAIAQLEAQQ